jgi:hypothetical protein
MKTITLLAFVLFAVPVFASVSPSSNNDPIPAFDLRKIKAKEIEKLTGKKLTLLQKIELKILQKKLRRQDDDDSMTAKQKKQATLSMIFGIAGLVLLFVPTIGLLALPFSILALVFGFLSLKGNSNTKAIVGVVTGGVTLIILLIALAFLAALFSWY